MESAVASALALAREQGATRVHRIVLRIGALAGVEPASLRFAFEAVTLHTPAAGAALDIDTVPARARCADCDLQFGAAPGFIFLCPACGRPSGELLQGRELVLARVEMS